MGRTSSGTGKRLFPYCGHSGRTGTRRFSRITIPAEAFFLPFLGEEAAVNKGPAVLAVRAKALVWPIALIRDGDRYRIIIEEPLDTALLEGDAEEKALAVAAFYTEANERMVRRAPDQWFWMHNRWKTKRIMDD